MAMPPEKDMKSLWQAIRQNDKNEFKKGASANAIELLEETLGIKLPHTYKQFLKEFDGGEFSFGRMHKITPEGAGGLDFLEQVEEAADYIPLVAARTIIPFGDDYGGNLYCFALNRADSDGEYPILLWDHEDHEEDEEPPEIEENFYEFVINELGLSSTTRTARDNDKEEDAYEDDPLEDGTGLQATEED
jgi:cell wall assembly regulator SMI1